MRESYDEEGHFYFGIFDVSPHAINPILNIPRAVRFFVDTIQLLPEFRDAHDIDRDLEGVPTERRTIEYARGSPCGAVGCTA
jgi:hypothetical protein